MQNEKKKRNQNEKEQTMLSVHVSLVARPAVFFRRIF